mmetsp:Transcript_15558/g.36825  ORF Transcript_15558/g.36825 Transcript_15558/m.36825 type:complete len:576 (-) Transcript_15558:886-2613(-)
MHRLCLSCVAKRGFVGSCLPRRCRLLLLQVRHRLRHFDLCGGRRLLLLRCTLLRLRLLNGRHLYLRSSLSKVGQGLAHLPDAGFLLLSRLLRRPRGLRQGLCDPLLLLPDRCLLGTCYIVDGSGFDLCGRHRGHLLLLPLRLLRRALRRRQRGVPRLHGRVLFRAQIGPQSVVDLLLHLLQPHQEGLRLAILLEEPEVVEARIWDEPHVALHGVAARARVLKPALQRPLCFLPQSPHVLPRQHPTDQCLDLGGCRVDQALPDAELLPHALHPADPGPVAAPGSLDLWRSSFSSGQFHRSRLSDVLGHLLGAGQRPPALLPAHAGAERLLDHHGGGQRQRLQAHLGEKIGGLGRRRQGSLRGLVPAAALGLRLFQLQPGLPGLGSHDLPLLAHRKHCQLPGEGHDLLALVRGVQVKDNLYRLSLPQLLHEMQLAQVALGKFLQDAHRGRVFHLSDVADPAPGQPPTHLALDLDCDSFQLHEVGFGAQLLRVSPLGSDPPAEALNSDAGMNPLHALLPRAVRSHQKLPDGTLDPGDVLNQEAPVIAHGPIPAPGQEAPDVSLDLGGCAVALVGRGHR